MLTGFIFFKYEFLILAKTALFIPCLLNIPSLGNCYFVAYISIILNTNLTEITSASFNHLIELSASNLR